MSKTLNAAYATLKKDFESKLKQNLKPALDKYLQSFLTNGITSYRFELYDGSDGGGVCFDNLSLKFPPTKNSPAPYKVNETVYIDELSTNGVIKEIHGNEFLVRISKIETDVKLEKKHISKLEGADEDDTDEEGYIYYEDTHNKKAEVQGNKIWNALNKLNLDILADVFGVEVGEDEVSVYVTEKGVTNHG